MSRRSLTMTRLDDFNRRAEAPSCTLLTSNFFARQSTGRRDEATRGHLEYSKARPAAKPTRSDKRRQVQRQLRRRVSRRRAGNAVRAAVPGAKAPAAPLRENLAAEQPKIHDVPAPVSASAPCACKSRTPHRRKASLWRAVLCCPCIRWQVKSPRFSTWHPKP